MSDTDITKPEDNLNIKVAGDQTVADNLEDQIKAGNEGELPEKLKGKSPQEIADMYVHAEQEKSRLGNEVGELRRTLLQQDISEPAQTFDKTEDGSERLNVVEQDFYDDPVGVIEKVVARSLKPLEERISQSAVQTELQRFENQHPDYLDIAQSPEFNAFVTKSPYRINLYNKAMKSDYLAADEIISAYKDYTGLQKDRGDASAQAAEAKRKQVLKDGALEGGSTNDSTGVVYYEHQIQKLIKSDPERYNALLPDIMLAYTEGRVKP